MVPIRELARLPIDIFLAIRYSVTMETTEQLKAERAALDTKARAMARRGDKAEDAERHALIRRIHAINKALAARRPRWA